MGGRLADMTILWLARHWVTSLFPQGPKGWRPLL